jgi:hypothetical protein
MTDRPPSRLPAPAPRGPAGAATASNDHTPHQDGGEDAADRLNPHVAAAVVDIFVYVVVLVLEAVAFVFSDRVSLGGFVSVTLLILALLLSRAAVRRLLHGPRSAQRTQS